MNGMKNKIVQDGVFIVALLLVSLLYGYHDILSFRPYSLHQWRQADCLSFTQNYYMEGMRLFKPAIHNISEKVTGKTVSEFPILYYFVAGLWKIFGKHEFIYRLLNVLIVFTGLLSLFKVSKDILKDYYWSVFIALFLFSSPVLVFYTNNFLTNAPALGLALTGWLFFYRFYTSGKNRFLYISMIFFLFAGLLKISSLISYIVIVSVFLVEFFNITSFRNEEKIFHSPLKHFISLSAVFLIIATWLIFAIHYNSHHNSNTFLQGILPIWELDFAHIKNIFHDFKINILPQLFYDRIFYFLIILAFTTMILMRRNCKILNFITILLILGSIMFGILWYQVFNVHDYYLIDLLVLPVFILLSSLIFLRRNYFKLFKSIFIKIVTFLVLCFNIYYCAVITRIKYYPNDTIADNSYFVSRWGIDKTWRIYHKKYNDNFKAIETITPYLRSLGISRNDMVISIPDQSPNISLYLMDQKGFTDFGFNNLKGEIRFSHFIALGAKYLIVNNDSLNKLTYIKPFIHKKIGNYKNVYIYDVKNRVN
jgi:hypothetical protein